MPSASIPLACRGRNYPTAALSGNGVIRVRSDEPGFEWYHLLIRFPTCLQPALRTQFGGVEGISDEMLAEINDLAAGEDGGLFITDVVGVVCGPATPRPLHARTVFQADRIDYQLRVDCDRNLDFWLEVDLPVPVVSYLRSALREASIIGRVVVSYETGHCGERCDVTKPI